MTRTVVTGAGGQLGTAIAELIPRAERLSREDIDLRATGRIRPFLEGLKPDLVINCAAFTAVDAAESDEGTAYLVNAVAPAEIAAWCGRNGAKFVTFSTDYVFDGEADRPYVESDPVGPLNAYGRTKAAGEALCLDANPDGLVIRTSWLISHTHQNFATKILERAKAGPVRVVDDQYGSPTVAVDLATATLELIDAGLSGIVHVANQGSTTWCGLAVRTLELAGVDPSLAVPISSGALDQPAERPRWSVLASERLAPAGIQSLPPWGESLPTVVARLLGDTRAAGSPAIRNTP